MARFSGKSALVTGGSSGVGRAIAIALAKEKARVCVVGRDRGSLRETLDMARQFGGDAFSVVADMRDFPALQAAVSETCEQFGGVDLVANAAGILKMGSVPSMSEADWDLTFDTNVKGVYLLLKAVVPRMQKQGGGAIVNVSSVFAHAAAQGSAAYAASKAAVVALTKVMALDHIGQGIRINGVAPGSMRTPMLESLAKVAAPDNPEAVLGAAAKLHPIGRLIDPEEVASLVLYLLSDEAAAIVGTTVTIDGGRLAKLGSA